MTEKTKIKIESSWSEALKEHFKTDEFIELTKKVRELYLTKRVFPEPKNLFNAFNLCPYEKTKVVILGQDPYHGKGQAHGLSFSVQEGVPQPPSLKNIFKEMQDDLGKDIPSSGDLTYLAKQGVFLLNSILTVEERNPTSHRNIGWEEFTDEVIKTLSSKKEKLVFILWGSFAKEKEYLIDSNKHLILKAPHPSPYSANSGFFGCRHFSTANKYLKENDLGEISW